MEAHSLSKLSTLDNLVPILSLEQQESAFTNCNIYNWVGWFQRWERKKRLFCFSTVLKVASPPCQEEHSLLPLLDAHVGHGFKLKVLDIYDLSPFTVLFNISFTRIQVVRWCIPIWASLAPPLLSLQKSHAPNCVFHRISGFFARRLLKSLVLAVCSLEAWGFKVL